MSRSTRRPAAALRVFYDGDCGFCTALACWAQARARPGHVQFLPLQTPQARDRLARFGLDAARLDSLVLLESATLSFRSTAALRLCRHLSPPWPLLAAALLIPPSWRDRLYAFIARHRHRFRPHRRA